MSGPPEVHIQSAHPDLQNMFELVMLLYRRTDALHEAIQRIEDHLQSASSSALGGIVPAADVLPKGPPPAAPASSSASSASAALLALQPPPSPLPTSCTHHSAADMQGKPWPDDKTRLQEVWNLNELQAERVWPKLQSMDQTIFAENMNGWKQCQDLINSQLHKFRFFASESSTRGFEMRCRSCSQSCVLAWPRQLTQMPFQDAEFQRQKLLTFLGVEINKNAPVRV